MIKKLLERCGETISETLVAVLIISLAGGALAAMITASSRIQSSADEADKNVYEASSNVEERKSSSFEGSDDISVTVKNSYGRSGVVNFEVDFYSDGGVRAYEKGADV